MSPAKKNKTHHRPTTPPTCTEDPFAVTTSGIVLLNVQNFDGVVTADDALQRALRERMPLFIGVAMDAREVRLVVEHLRDVWHEAAGSVIGTRQRRTR
jgi:hypothetical protein